MLLYEDHESIVTALAFSPDGSLLASGGRDGSIILNNPLGENTRVRSPFAKPLDGQSVAFLSGRSLLLGHDRGWEILNETTTGWEPSEQFAIINVTGLAVLSASRIAVGVGDRTNRDTGMFQLFDLKLNRALQPTFRELNGVQAVAACPAQSLVAWSCGLGRAIKVWDTRKQTPHSVRNKYECASLALAPDGSAVAAVQDWTVRVYDLNAKQDRNPLKGHKGIVSCVAFSPDGSTVATGSWDGTVRFWDPQSGQERAVFQWPVGKVFSLAFAPDGLRIAAGGDKGAVVVWDVE